MSLLDELMARPDLNTFSHPITEQNTQDQSSSTGLHRAVSERLPALLSAASKQIPILMVVSGYLSEGLQSISTMVPESQLRMYVEAARDEIQSWLDYADGKINGFGDVQVPGGPAESSNGIDSQASSTQED